MCPPLRSEGDGTKSPEQAPSDVSFSPAAQEDDTFRDEAPGLTARGSPCALVLVLVQKDMGFPEAD